MTQKFWVLRRPRVKAAVDDDAVQKLDMEPWGLKEKEMHYIQRRRSLLGWHKIDWIAISHGLQRIKKCADEMNLCFSKSV